MNRFAAILELPVEDLRKRRALLQDELDKTISELVTRDLRKEINELFTKAQINNALSVHWEFYPESDDEGGTVWYTNDIYVKFDGEEIDLYKTTYKEESWRKGTYYNTLVGDSLSEILSEYSDDLYSQLIEEIDLKEVIK